MPYRKQILVVEDNELNRAILCEILSQEYHTLEAGNGQEALRVLKEHPDDVALILLDVMMPVMDGYAFLDRIKADKKLSFIPVIVMTQGSSEADELNALAHGATDFVPKPYRPQIILHRIAGLIKLRETAAMVNQLQYDRLTGLYSKEYFFQKVRDQLLQDPDGAYAIICSNVENFKVINDSFGIQTGDQLLKEIASISKHKVGHAGFCGRFDADRFLFFMKQAPDGADCSQYEIVEKHTLSSPFQNVAIHWGVYMIHDPTVPVEHMCDRALLAADSIKHQYRSVAVYDDSLRSKLLREQSITAGMDTALQEGQFIIYLQPKYSLRDNCMAGAEALVRWIHPQWGFMSPGAFIPLFEKNGFIPKLDQYVWEQVCILLRKWKQQGLSLLPVSVNVSRADIFQADLANTIFSLTQKYDIDPAYLHLEITESAYVEKTSRIASTVAALRKMGFVIELDDFGSGYSSLNTMSQLPLDLLKLDMKFIQSELSKPADQSVLVDVISMAHRTHLNVVAEGVETHDQINRLRSVGCDYVQGFFLAKPMPAAEFEELLKTNQSNLIRFQPGTQRSGVSMPNLLVADPDAAYREAVRKYFAGQYAVLEADNAGDALSYFRSGNGNNIAAVILCAATAGRDAQALLKTLRQNPAHWDVPVLATIPNSACANQYPLVQEADDFLCKCHPISDLRRRVQRVIEIATFQRKESILRDAANRDHLTGLFNRRGLQEAMRSIVDTDFPLALCLVDLDDLKQLNDTFGHDQGDWLLQSFSYLIRRMTHTEDILCRYGGDEFILVLKHLHSPGTAVKKCEAICRAFQKHTEKEGFPNSCSIGIALCDSIDELSASLITRADQVLYRAKRENKGGCVLWEEA